MCIQGLNESDVNCLICYENVFNKQKKGIKIIALSCGHIYCQACIRPDLQNKTCCHLCREDKYFLQLKLNKSYCRQCKIEITCENRFYFLSCGHVYCGKCLKQQKSKYMLYKCKPCKLFEYAYRLYI